MNYPCLDFLGEKLDKEMAKKICTGELDPETKQEYKEVSLTEKQMKVYNRKIKTKEEKREEKKSKKKLAKGELPKKTPPKNSDLRGFFKSKS